MNDLAGAKYLSIYLGNVCNFDCKYCDRDYIKNEKGGQKFEKEDVPKVIDFIKSLSVDGTYPLRTLNFHGGEPFVYVHIMDTILDEIDKLYPNSNFKFYIQTNGSLILKNDWFIKKWANRIFMSISYDFLFQNENRTTFDIDGTIELLKEHIGADNIQFQFVVPIDKKNALGLDAVKSISDVMIKNDIKRINLIPLRHIRGAYKFKVIVDEIDLNAFFNAFMRFTQILYVLGLRVVIDGHESGMDKRYFDNHKQFILSPDGYIYPEYDFLEYKMYSTTIGTWKKLNSIPIKVVRHNPTQEDHLLHTKCISCNSRSSCGLKFLYKEFGVTPGDNCVKFYNMLDVLIAHIQKLRNHSSLLHSIGI